MTRNSIAATLAALALVVGVVPAQADTRAPQAFQPSSVFGQLDRLGFDRLAASNPDLVHLYTAGNDCRGSDGAVRIGTDRFEPTAQLANASCTLSQMMGEAGVTSGEIIAARIRFTDPADARMLQDFVASNLIAGAPIWIIEQVDALPTSSPYQRFSLEVVALSSDSAARLNSAR